MVLRCYLNQKKTIRPNFHKDKMSGFYISAIDSLSKTWLSETTKFIRFGQGSNPWVSHDKNYQNIYLVAGHNWFLSADRESSWDGFC